MAVVTWFRLLRAALRPATGPLTLDQLRSELSHETSAKLGRLRGLAREWSRSGFARDDFATLQALVASLEHPLMRQARLPCARWRSSRAAATLLARFLLLASEARAWRAEPPDPHAAAARLSAHVDAIHGDSQALVESLSARFGVRLGDLLISAAGEVAHEYEGRPDGAVAIAFDGEPRALGVWVPRADGAAWTDALRNILRNAAQATHERWAAQPSPPTEPVPVTVRVLPARDRPCATIEILDEGVGMDAARVAAMWRAGQSSHGAALEVRSVPDVGTCVRLDLPHRDVPIHAPLPWQLRPIAWPSAAALATAAIALPLWLHGPAVSATIENHRVVVARDAHGRPAWRRDMGDRVEPNWWGELIQRQRFPGDDALPMLIPSSTGGEPDVVVTTRTDSGTAWLWRLRPGGPIAWSRELHWTAPIPEDSVSVVMLRSVFQHPVAWGDDTLGAIAVNVRDRDEGPTAIEFFSPDGDSLGAYYHPGHLEPVDSFDLDGDGHREFLMSGCNNPARFDTTFLPAAVPDSVYIACLVLLAAPDVNGQAYPYARWAGLPPAREKAYLLIPPLRRDLRPTIARLMPGQRASHGHARLAVQMGDGRVYLVDGLLRPLACEVGDHTEAARLPDPRPMAPLLYIHDGVIERPDIPVGGGR